MFEINLSLFDYLLTVCRVLGASEALGNPVRFIHLVRTGWQSMFGGLANNHDVLVPNSNLGPALSSTTSSNSGSVAETSVDSKPVMPHPNTSTALVPAKSTKAARAAKAGLARFGQYALFAFASSIRSSAFSVAEVLQRAESRATAVNSDDSISVDRASAQSNGGNALSRIQNLIASKLGATSSNPSAAHASLPSSSSTSRQIPLQSISAAQGIPALSLRDHGTMGKSSTAISSKRDESGERSGHWLWKNVILGAVQVFSHCKLRLDHDRIAIISFTKLTFYYCDAVELVRAPTGHGRSRRIGARNCAPRACCGHSVHTR